jgi:hypothetical protein
MKNIISLYIILLVLAMSVVTDTSQERRPADAWNWIIPLRTNKADIEKIFGSPTTEDKSNPFQTYVSEFGKITVVYARDRRVIEETSCTVEKDTVLNYSVSPSKLALSNLGFDMKLFLRDSTYSPREIGYFSEALGVLIDTTLILSTEKCQTEQVVLIEYHAPKDFRCSKPSTK